MSNDTHQSRAESQKQTTSREDLAAVFWSASDDTLLDRATMAAGIRKSVAWAAKKASEGGGPAFIKLGHGVLYRKRDVLEWVEQTGRRVRSTSELSLMPSPA